MYKYKMSVLGTFIALLTAGISDAQKETSVADEVKSFQGVWQVTKWIDSEVRPRADEIKGMSFEFKKDTVIKRTDAGRPT